MAGERRNRDELSVPDSDLVAFASLIFVAFRLLDPTISSNHFVIVLASCLLLVVHSLHQMMLKGGSKSPSFICIFE